MFQNPARQHVRPLTSGPTRVKGSRRVSLVASAGRAENAEAIGWSAASGDALMRASAGSNVHASHRSSDATLRPQSRCVCAGRDTTHYLPSALLAPESGGLRERGRPPSILTRPMSHAHTSCPQPGQPQANASGRVYVVLRMGPTGRPTCFLALQACPTRGNLSRTHDAIKRRSQI